MSVRGIRGATGRRGLLAGAAAVVAGGLAKLAGPGRAEAGHNPSGMAVEDPNAMHLGNTNSRSTQTQLVGTNGLVPLLEIRNNTGNSYGGAGALVGATGTTGAVGIIGTNTGTGGIGVLGISAFGTGIGVQGTSTSNEGVHGNSSSGIGVVGLSTSNYGVYGFSANTNGIVGQSGGNGAALVGYTRNGIGVFGGVTGGGAGVAGYFDGPVFVKSLTVAGGAKSASVKDKQGVDRRMYCQESPEPWFEDFGTAELRNGQASVALDPEFDEVVDGTDYRVFLTAIGDTGFLYVSRKGPHRFEVRSERGATASGSFDYRVVARRADPVGGRLEKIRIPDVAKLKEAPAPPKRPAATPPAPERER